MTELKAGDIVRGPFPVSDRSGLSVLQPHWSVVLSVKDGAAVLVYITSLKEASAARQVFSREDMMMAGFTKPCRWDASKLALIEDASVLVRTGRLSKGTFRAIQDGVNQARAQKSLAGAGLKKDGGVYAL